MICTFIYFQVIPEEQFSFNTDVRIGWTFESVPGKDAHWVPIAFEFQESYKLYFLNLDVPNTIYPNVNNEYIFGKLPYPAVFSVSMTVDTSKYIESYFKNTTTKLCYGLFFSKKKNKKKQV